MSKLSINEIDSFRTSTISISSTDTDEDEALNINKNEPDPCNYIHLIKLRLMFFFLLTGTFGILTPKAPFRGLSIKEVEERLSTLQKENFSLKLRLYLLEERAGTTITLDKEVIIKENVDLKVFNFSNDTY